MWSKYVLVLLVVLLNIKSVESRRPKNKLKRNRNNSFGFNQEDDRALLERKPSKKVTRKKTRKIKVTKQVDPSNKFSYVPASILTKLRKVKTMEDFVKKFDVQLTKQEVFNNSLTVDALPSFRIPDQKEFECHPRPKLVEIPIDYSSSYWPSCIQLNQCGGCCQNTHNMECVPSALTNKSTIVFKIPHSTGIPMMHTVYMLHHASCKCQCRVQAADCLPAQTYDAGNCQCECKKKEEKCPPGRQWDQRKCKCECSYKRNCARKYTWSVDACRCECTKKKCRTMFKLDPSTCKCLFMYNYFG